MLGLGGKELSIVLLFLAWKTGGDHRGRAG